MMESLSYSPPHAVVVELPCDFLPHRLRRRLPQFVELPNLHIFVVGVAMFAIIFNDVVDSVADRHLLDVAQDDAPGQFQIPCGLRLVGVHRGRIGDAIVAPATATAGRAIEIKPASPCSPPAVAGALWQICVSTNSQTKSLPALNNQQRTSYQ